MKKNKLIKLLFTFCLPILVVSCAEEIGDEQSPTGTGTDFEILASSWSEIDGTGTITIPLRNGTVSESEISFTGTATEGEDFELLGVTSEGIQISVIDDNDFEPLESIKVVIESTGNNVHTINVYSNCEDTENPYVEYFIGDWAALEDYGAGGTYGPYTIHLVQDSEDPNKFTFDDFYDSGCDAYMIFDVAAGTVYFPDQAPCDEPLTASTGTFTVDDCNNNTDLVINVDFDGGPWVYRFSKL
jgi:hypothetical protein